MSHTSFPHMAQYTGPGNAFIQHAALARLPAAHPISSESAVWWSGQCSGRSMAPGICPAHAADGTLLNRGTFGSLGTEHYITALLSATCCVCTACMWQQLCSRSQGASHVPENWAGRRASGCTVPGLPLPTLTCHCSAGWPSSWLPFPCCSTLSPCPRSTWGSAGCGGAHRAAHHGQLFRWDR